MVGTATTQVLEGVVDGEDHERGREGDRVWCLVSLEGWQKLKFQYFGHLMRRVDSLEKTLMMGGIGGRRRRRRQRMRWLDGVTDSMDVILSPRF